MSSRAKWSIAAGLAAAAAGLAVFLVLQHRAGRPSDSVVRSYLDREVAAKPIVFVKLERTDVPVGPARLRVDFNAEAATLEPLYEVIDTAAFLGTTLGLDVAAVKEARSLLQGRNATRLRELAGLESIPADVLARVVVREASPKGATATYSGSLEARRVGSTWSLDLAEGDWTSALPAGRPRNSLPADVVLVGDRAGEQQLRAAAAAYLDCATKLADARRRLEAELAAGRQTRIESFLARLAPGTLYRGTATQRGNQGTTLLVLEIVSAKADSRRVEARLRNDGGWADSRRFLGEWSSDAEAETFNLSLATVARDAIPNAGPFLDYNGEWTLPLACEADGALTAQTNPFAYRFTPVAAADAGAVRDELAGDFTRLQEATRAGVWFTGAAISKANNGSEPVLLQFTRQDNDGALLQALLQSPERADWRRPLSGTLVGNRHRAEGRPLRLQMAADTAVGSARRGSVFQANDGSDGLSLSLALGDGATITGEDERFRYRFTRASDEQIASVQAGWHALARRFAGLLRAGVAYDGIARDEQGFSTRLRLRIRRLQSESKTLQVSIESLQQNGIFHALAGSYDTDAGTLHLASSGAAKYNPNGVLKVPLFSRDDAFQIALELGETSLAGPLLDRHGGNLDWQIEFNLPAGSSAGAGAAAADTPAPALPTTAGAYVLSSGQWLPLPNNNGRVVQSVSTLVGGLLGALAKPTSEPVTTPDKLAELVFDGAETAPEVAGSAVTIAFVGRLQKIPAEMLAKYPELDDGQDIDVAPTRRGSDGKRRADLLRIVPGVSGLKYSRIAAYTENPAEDVVILTATGDVPAGTYVVAGYTGTDATSFFELRVR